MRVTFVSKGGPRAEELLAGLSELYPVYEAEPGVFDVYSDDRSAIYDVLDSVTPGWRMYLQVDNRTEGVAPRSGPPIVRAKSP
jgi:hypothetical protein